MTRLRLEDWLVEQVRLTAFPVLGFEARPAEWWKATLGTEADEITQDLRKGVFVASGAALGEKLSLTCDSARIDWRLAPRSAEPLLAAPEMPSLGAANEVFESFSSVSQRWLAIEDLPAITRLAFGTSLIHADETIDSCYQRIPDYLPVNLEPDASDFSMQVNYRQQSEAEVEHLAINRLSKWAVISVQFAGFALSGAGVTQELPRRPVHLMKVELDINTAPEFPGELPRERLVKIFEELMRLGSELVERGLVAS